VRGRGDRFEEDRVGGRRGGVVLTGCAGDAELSGVVLRRALAQEHERVAALAAELVAVRVDGGAAVGAGDPHVGYLMSSSTVAPRGSSASRIRRT